MVKKTGDIIGDKTPKPETTEIMIVVMLIIITFTYVLSRSGLLQWFLRWVGLQ